MFFALIRCTSSTTIDAPTIISATSPRTRIAFNTFIWLLFFVVNTVLFSLFLVFVWLCFCYVIDYFIYKGLKGLKTEEKRWLYSAKTVFFQFQQSIEVYFENICVAILKITRIINWKLPELLLVIVCLYISKNINFSNYQRIRRIILVCKAVICIFVLFCKM